MFLSSVDASRAGAGNLEIIVSAANDNVPNFVKAEGNARFEVSFTPQVPETHLISVKFNGDTVPGQSGCRTRVGVGMPSCGVSGVAALWWWSVVKLTQINRPCAGL